ncbi:MAG TPA: PqqD family peptide modification chaperone [Thermoanaerobaculia bacterium]
MEPERQRLAQLAVMLKRVRDRLRYVDYQQAERDCEVLAEKILERWSRSELERASFAAIPRGGLIVLGMLSYALGLKTEQFREGPGTLFLVDDCALTGARFASRLKEMGSREVVFVHLYSHPDLRKSIEEKEERVAACLAAHDLADMAPASFPDPERLAEWRRRWRERLGERYWYGQPEPVCFAWNEPDRPFWNEATGQVEDGWRLLPPHLCLKTRAALGGPPPEAQEEREWQAPDDVVSGEFDGVLWLCHTRTEQVFSLSGTGADLWRWLACWGSIELTARRLAQTYGVDPETAQRDTLAFARELEGAGLLRSFGVAP